METGLLIKIHNYELYASPAEKNFIRQLNAEPEKFTQKNLRQIAEMTYASPATIIRLCRKLDYKGFRDFQRALVYETALSRKSMKLSMQDVLYTTYVNRHYSELSGKFEKTQIHKSMEM